MNRNVLKTNNVTRQLKVKYNQEITVYRKLCSGSVSFTERCSLDNRHEKASLSSQDNCFSEWDVSGVREKKSRAKGQQPLGQHQEIYSKQLNQVMSWRSVATETTQDNDEQSKKTNKAAIYT